MKKRVVHHIKHNWKAIVVIAVIVAAVFLYIIYRTPGAQVDENCYPDAGTAKLDFYVMSQCPYGTQVEDAIKPVLDVLGCNVEFSLNFIAGDAGNGNFNSLHGQNEVKGDIVQLCAAKHEPKKYMDMVVCMNTNANSIPNSWESCAKDKGLDADKIKSCYEGEEGKQLLSESIKKSQAVNAQGSPTMYLNGALYQGQRDSLSFQRALCANLEGHPACANIPKCASDADCPQKQGKEVRCNSPGKENAECEYIEPAKIELLVLNDKKCSSCDTSQILQVVSNIFPGAEPREVDVSSEEGKKLVEQMDIMFVPAYIFDENLVKSYTWNSNPNIKGAFEKIGEHYKLVDEATGSTYFASEEARKAYYGAIGIVTGDNKPQIDFFVMSYCPYGNQAEEVIEPVYQLLKDKADFNPRYVIYPFYQGGGDDYCIADGKYCSMHGVQELNQDIRELCVNKYMGVGKWFEFALAMNAKCTYKNADSCWENVAKEIGLDTEKIKDCQSKEAEEIAKKEVDLSTLLKVSGSPTIFIEGESYSGQRDAESVKVVLCGKFDTAPSECGQKISSGSAQPAAEGQC